MPVYELECVECGIEREHYMRLSEWTPDGVVLTGCVHCDSATVHKRHVSAPAKYLGDRMESPKVYGGRFDTMGRREPSMEMPLPQETLGDDGWGVYTEEACKEHFHTREYKAWESEAKAVDKENEAKRERADKLGETVDIRHNKLPGDPAL